MVVCPTSVVSIALNYASERSEQKSAYTSPIYLSEIKQFDSSNNNDGDDTDSDDDNNYDSKTTTVEIAVSVNSNVW